MAAAVLSFCGIGVASAYTSAQTDIAWYTADPEAAVFVISDAGDFAGLAQLVNGTYDAEGDGAADYPAIDFAGKTIQVTDGFSFLFGTFLSGTYEPVGTAEHPFQGTLTGWDADNSCPKTQTVTYKLDVDAADEGALTENLGLFGYVGEDGSISNIQIGSQSSVTINVEPEDSMAIKSVGSLAGFCAGSINDCSSAATITLTSAAVLDKDVPTAISGVGGLVGQCIGGLSGDSFSGEVSIECTSSTYEAQAGDFEGISEGTYMDVAEHIGGVCGLFGSFDDMYTHGSIIGCSNSGHIITELTGVPKWGERFSEWIFPEEGNVGGVVGYSFGSISHCTNSGDVQTCTLLYGADSSSNPNIGRDTYSGADGAGGIVGNLRAETANGSADSDTDFGIAGDQLAITDCTNSGLVEAYHAGGGIAGVAGTYTTALRCSNTGNVNVYRWNKPSGAGIEGQSYGSVGFCYNMGTVTSVPGAGFYCAGIVGMSFRYWDAAMNPLSPDPEIYSCYNAGVIAVNAGNGNWKQGGIVGQYDGYVHDNLLLENVCYNDRITNGDGQDYGTLGANTVLSSAELKSNTALLALNTTCDVKGWDSYFTLVDASTLNREGYPVINSQVPEEDLGTNDLSTGTVVASCVEDAPYSGLESIPELTATYNGTTLVQDVDFKVLPQAGATAFTSGERPYLATIVGIGAYSGETADKVPYGIAAGDLSTCSVVIRSSKFNWEDQPPTKDMITVRDTAGNLVSPEYWDFEAVGDANGQFINYKRAQGGQPAGYKVTIIPIADADGQYLFSGTLEGRYLILKASIQGDCYTLGITYDGATYYWDDDSQDWKNGVRPMFAYTGESILPEIIGVEYLGRPLTLGVDYKVVYGNPNSETNSASAVNPNIEITDEDGTNRACVTARYVNEGAYRNFNNFTNLLFDIVDPETTLPSFTCEDQAWTGEAVEPFKDSYAAQDSWTLTEGVDYQVVYGDNTDCGIATFTVTGLGKYAGSPERTGAFAIHKGTLPEFSCGAQTYTGSPIEPFKDSYTAGALLLTEGSDYTVVYSNNTAAGTASFTITGQGTYAGQTQEGSFQIIDEAITQVLKFDFNNDGKLSAADLTKMRLIIAARLAPASDEELEFWHLIMDYGYETGASGSGTFNAADLTHLRLRIADREAMTYVDLPAEYQGFLPD